MTYDEALKQVQAKQEPLQAFLEIRFSYHCKIILPYKQGMQVIESLQQGWFFNENYSAAPELRPLQDGDLDFHIRSKQEVQNIQMAQLLNVSLTDLNGLKPTGTHSATF